MFTVQKTSVTDTAIQTNGLRDLYAVLGDERDGAAVLRLHVNPLAPWIWLGALVMAAGGALSLADRRLRMGARAASPGAGGRGVVMAGTVNDRADIAAEHRSRGRMPASRHPVGRLGRACRRHDVRAMSWPVRWRTLH